MSPAELREAAEQAHAAATLEADQILNRADLAQEYIAVAAHLLESGDRVLAPELVYRAGLIDSRFAHIHATYFGGHDDDEA